MVKTSRENKGTDSLLGSGEGWPGAICCRGGEMWGHCSSPIPYPPSSRTVGKRKTPPRITKRASPEPTPFAWDKGPTRAPARYHKGPPATRLP